MATSTVYEVNRENIDVTDEETEARVYEWCTKSDT